MEGAADVAETSYAPEESEPDAAPVRLIVRRVVPNLPSSPTTAITLSSPIGSRRHAEIENAIRDLKYGATPPGWRCRDGPQPGALDRAHPTGNHRPLGDASSPWTAHPLGAPPHFASAQHWPENQFLAPWHDSARCLSRLAFQLPRQLAPASASCRVLSRHLQPLSAPPIAPTDRRPTSNLPEPEPSRLNFFTPFRYPWPSNSGLAEINAPIVPFGAVR